MGNPIISGRYRILQQLSEGGFSQTFIAEDLQLPTKPKCVVKKLRPQFGNEQSVQMVHRLFEQEAEVLYRLGGHPHIPQLLAHFSQNGEFYLVQELIEGNTFAHEQFRRNKFSEREIIKFLGQVVETLSFVHEKGVIHQDIKPANLISRYTDGKIFLIDFGTVKQINSSHDAQMNVTVGSHGYTAFEQIADAVCFASDLYSLGLVAIELLTGIHPANLQKDTTGKEFVWQQNANISKSLADFISRLVRYNYQERFATANEASAVLSGIAAQYFAENPTPFQPVSNQNPNTQITFPQTHSVNSTESVNQPNKFKGKNNSNNAAYIPPTIISTPRSYQKPTPKPAPKKKGFGSWLWKNDLALGAFVTVFVFGSFIFGGFILIKTFSANSSNSAKYDTNSMDTYTSRKSSLSFFREASAQAAEAQKKEKKAVFKHEWEEVSSYYERASKLFAAISETDEKFETAQEQNRICLKKAANARQNAENARVISNPT